ncbi:hypothetical protein ACFV2X_38130 [Streptomyces sp. NPDC059679]|uniref:hypothetical protein n=1 Tax=Streptomyces sp. NPDC059679 TaxID=3346903 RepID=UPI003681DDE4
MDTAIAKAVQAADNWHDLECHVHAISVAETATMLMRAQVPGAVCDCTGPASVLRRCAADRKLLDLHGGRMHSCPAKDETGYLDEWKQFDHGDICPAVQLLAEGYGWTEGER